MTSVFDTMLSDQMAPVVVFLVLFSRKQDSINCLAC